MMIKRVDPAAVLDPGQDRQITGVELDARLDWLRSQGIDPKDVRRVEIYRIDRADTAFYAHVTVLLRDAAGGSYCDVAHPHSTNPDSCRLATGSYLVMLSAFPPKATGLDLYKEWAS